jgi:hypothetical protein
MTVIALVFLPIVLAYQSWTYYVFRRRISDMSFRPAAPAAPRPAVAAEVVAAAQPSGLARDTPASRRGDGRARRRRLKPWTRRRE